MSSEAEAKLNRVRQRLIELKTEIAECRRILRGEKPA